MSIEEKIRALSWYSSGEAKAIYDDFVRSPCYEDKNAVFKLLICLAYEEQYRDVQRLAEEIRGMYQDNREPLIIFFNAMSSDMLGERDKALKGYREILACESISSWEFNSLRIPNFCREFIEHLMMVPYSPQEVRNFKFPPVRKPYEARLSQSLPVKHTEHFSIYYYPGSVAESEIETIAALREEAYTGICEFLGVSPALKVDLYFFNDHETKYQETRSQGHGWAYGYTMVEVYNDEVKLNPYHELVHVLAEEAYGPTISAPNEGLAVYLSWILGGAHDGDILNTDYRKKTYEFYLQGELLPLGRLLTIEIGPDGSQPIISYRQAASVVEYLLETIGRERFFELWVLLHASYDETASRENIRKIEEFLGMPLTEIEERWLERVKVWDESIPES